MFDSSGFVVVTAVIKNCFLMYAAKQTNKTVLL